MILNIEELKQAIRKQVAGDEPIRFEVEAHLQRSKGPEAEGLLAVTPKRLLFAHRSPFGDPEVVPYERVSLSIVGKEEDIFGATLKLKAGEEPFVIRKVNPSDFKQVWAELSGGATDAGVPLAAPSQPPPLTTTPIEQQERAAFLGTITSAPPAKGPAPTPTPVFKAPCYVHPTVESKTKCEGCGKPICQDCMIPHNYRTYCPTCYEEAKVKGEVRKDRRPVTAPAPPAQPLRVPHGAKVLARSPALAFLLSFFPGLGQFYNRQTGKGVFVLFGSFVFFPIWFWGFYDAVKQAQNHNAARGIDSEPAGCLVFLLVIFPLAVIFTLVIIIGSNHTPEKSIEPQKITTQSASVGAIPAIDLEAKQTKIKTLLEKYYSLQKDYFEKNKKFMKDIPEQIKTANDSGYQLEVIMLGKKLDDYRLYAWAPVGDNKKLDLWSIDSGGSIFHEYAPAIK